MSEQKIIVSPLLVGGTSSIVNPDHLRRAISYCMEELQVDGIQLLPMWSVTREICETMHEAFPDMIVYHERAWNGGKWSSTFANMRRNKRDLCRNWVYDLVFGFYPLPFGHDPDTRTQLIAMTFKQHATPIGCADLYSHTTLIENEPENDDWQGAERICLDLFHLKNVYSEEEAKSILYECAKRVEAIQLHVENTNMYDACEFSMTDQGYFWDIIRIIQDRKGMSVPLIIEGDPRAFSDPRLLSGMVAACRR